ncbi:B3 domain-containing protein Os04g0386900-like [Bidens hawaiensis]|uniref:B3 domain-containing protein Os04g0386900-like n=1 Tax=Bidens hawaiensis TaxID=980011 RepID=UPI00404AF9DA
MERGKQKPAAQTDSQRDPDFWPLSEKPYFHVVLSVFHLTTVFRMSIPRDLSQNLPVAKVPAKIVYQGKVWDLLYLGDQGVGRCKLEKRTWAKFATDNKLNVGDACVFELMEGGPNSASIKFRVQVLKDDPPAELLDKVEGSHENSPITID